MDYIRLFEPVRIHTLELKNRIVMPAMGLSYTNDYSFTNRYKAFYRERARGGVGLMTIGPMAIDKVGSAPFMPALFGDEFIGPIRNFTDELHRDTDVKLSTQLFHMGRYAFSFLSGMQPIAPSSIPSKLTRETPREMTAEDIDEVQTAFAQAARRATEAGFDMVEILGCTGYLISQFLSPVTNHRMDEYGGSVENRMRFGLEVIQRVKEAVGEDFPVGIRIAGHDFMEGGNTNIEAARFAAAAEKAGVHAINVTGGWHETNVPQLTTNVPPGVFTYLARGIKNAVTVPVFASNRLGNPDVAERALRSDACDLICWARPLLADPELANKVKEGRTDEIVPCIACNQACFDSIFAGISVSCVMNPRAGREDETVVERASVKKKVLVAGGGPAGMMFAITAAQRGHDVLLCEQSSSLGGQVRLAQIPPGKAEFGNITRSLENRMKKAGVDIRLETPVTPNTIREEAPDAVVTAGGALPITPDIPGIDKPHVVSAWDVLFGKVPHIGKNVVVVGGSATGCETALFIASMNAPDPETFTFLMYHGAEDPGYAAKLLHDPGRKIVVIDMVQRMAENVGRTARWSLIKSLKLSGVDLRPGLRLVEITDTGVVVDTGEGVETIPADTVVIAMGAVSENRLAEETAKAGTETIIIGDAKSPRRLTEAIREALDEALKI